MIKRTIQYNPRFQGRMARITSIVIILLLLVPGLLNTLGQSTDAATSSDRIVPSARGDDDKGRQEDYDLLIIQGDIQADGPLQELVGYKQGIGIRTRLAKLQDILASTTGRDDAEKVKRYIYDQYIQDHIRYVLLIGSGVGDDPVLPVRYATSNLIDNPENPYPTDLYFSDLSFSNGWYSSWDTDGDDLFGVYEKDDVDYQPEVAIGRIPARTRKEVEVAVSHIINYSNRDQRPDPGGEGDWFRKAILVGTDTHPPWATPSTHNPNMATGEFQVDHLAEWRLPGYEVHKFKEWDGTISTKDIFSELNEGAGIFYISDHGYHKLKEGRYVNIAVWNVSWDEIRPVVTEDIVANMSNGEKLPLVLVNICEGAEYDKEGKDGFLVSLFFNPNGGAIGYFSASRTAWDGNGRYSLRTFSGRLLDNIFQNLEQGPPTYGDAISAAQDKYARENLPVGLGQWLTLVQFNYFGDPSIVPGGAGVRITTTSPQVPHSLDEGGTAEFTITNDLGRTVDVQLAFTGVPVDWTVELSDTDLHLQPFTTKRIEVSYQWSPGAVPGDNAEGRLILRDASNGQVLDLAKVQLRVADWEQAHSFDVTSLGTEWTSSKSSTEWTVHDAGAPHGSVLRYQKEAVGDYNHMMDDSISTVLGLEDATGNVSLTFFANYTIEKSYDNTLVEVSEDGTSWSLLMNLTGDSGGWVEHQANLSSLAGTPGHIRFRFISDECTNDWGITLDNVTVSNESYTYFHEDFEGGLDNWTNIRIYFSSPMIDLRTASRAILRLDTSFDTYKTDTGLLLRVWSTGNISYWGLDTLMGHVPGPETRYLNLDEYAGRYIRLRLGPFPDPDCSTSGLSTFSGIVWMETREKDITIQDVDLPEVLSLGENVSGRIAIVNNGNRSIDDVPVTASVTLISTNGTTVLLNSTVDLDTDDEAELVFDWAAPIDPSLSGWYRLEVASSLTGDAFPMDNTLVKEFFLGDVRIEDDFEKEDTRYVAPKGEFDVAWNRVQEGSHSGNFSWTSGDGSTYIDDTNIFLFLPEMDLSGLDRTYISFWHRSEMEVEWDIVTLEVRKGEGAWTPVESYSGIDFSWRRSVVDITEHSGPGTELRFVMRSDSSVHYRGWFMDDLAIFGVPEYINLSLGSNTTGITVPPGTRANFTAKVTNHGNIEAEVDITLEGPRASWGSIDLNYTTIPPGGDLTIPVNVTIPLKMEAGSVGVMTLVVTPRGHEGLGRSMNLSVHVERVTSINIGLDDIPKERYIIRPGTITNFPLRIENLGNGEETVAINCTLAGTDQGASPPNGTWDVSNPDNVTVSPWSSSVVQISVLVNNATFGDEAVVIINATPSSDTNVSDNTTLDLTVSRVRGLVLGPLDLVKGTPGSWVEVRVNITNTGNGPDDFALSARSQKGWVVEVEPSTTHDLDPGATVSVKVTVLIPELTQAGLRDIVEVIGRPVNSSDIDVTASFDIEVLWVRNITLSFPDIGTTALVQTQADVLTVNFSIHNLGNAPEGVHLTRSHVTGITASVPSPITVPSGGWYNGTIDIQVDKDAPIGSIVLEYSVRSDDGEEVLSKAQLNITIKKRTTGPSDDHGGVSMLEIGAIVLAVIIFVAAFAIFKWNRQKGASLDEEELEEMDEEITSEE